MGALQDGSVGVHIMGLAVTVAGIVAAVFANKYLTIYAKDTKDTTQKTIVYDSVLFVQFLSFVTSVVLGGFVLGSYFQSRNVVTARNKARNAARGLRAGNASDRSQSSNGGSQRGSSNGGSQSGSSNASHRSNQVSQHSAGHGRRHNNDIVTRQKWYQLSVRRLQQSAFAQAETGKNLRKGMSALAAILLLCWLVPGGIMCFQGWLHRYVKTKAGTRMVSICTPKDRTPTCDALWEVGIVTLIEALFLFLLLVICVLASSSKSQGAPSDLEQLAREGTQLRNDLNQSRTALEAEAARLQQAQADAEQAQTERGQALAQAETREQELSQVRAQLAGLQAAAQAAARNARTIPAPPGARAAQPIPPPPPGSNAQPIPPPPDRNAQYVPPPPGSNAQYVPPPPGWNAQYVPPPPGSSAQYVPPPPGRNAQTMAPQTAFPAPQGAYGGTGNFALPPGYNGRASPNTNMRGGYPNAIPLARPPGAGSPRPAGGPGGGNMPQVPSRVHINGSRTPSAAGSGRGRSARRA